MTTPVTLHGTQANGETLPVQVNAFGQLVAEGLEGPEGPKGEPFTYDDFTPEQLEGLTGPPGPPGADGPNDLKPYGPENSYLIIKNGKPTWISDGTDPEPPGPEHPLMLIDQRDLSTPAGLTDWGAYSDDGTFVLPPKAWDPYLREQTAWATPAAQRTGLCAKKAGGSSGKGMVVPFQMNLVGGFEKILRLIVVAESADTQGDTKTNLEVTYDTTYISPLVGKISSRLGNGPSFHELTFFVNRPDIGLVNFQLSHGFSLAASNTKAVWCGVQSWDYVDPSFYLLRQLSSKREALEELGTSLEELAQGD